MKKIIDHVNEDVLEKAVKRARERNIIIPTFKQQRNPELVPEKIKEKLKKVGLWDVNPLNLFRITWKNDIKTGLFGDVNYIEFPKKFTGVKNRIIGLVGKYFPTGAHKVGAAFGCLVPRLVSGEFDPTMQKAVWPSTGNYCRGGAFDCALLACTAVAILPEEMSRERFDWLKSIGAEVIATPGSESNVKEIYDKCWEIRNTKPDHVIFNQFDEFGNSIWHYYNTGSAVEEVYNKLKDSKSRMAAFVSATGSAGTIAAGDYLKKIKPAIKVVASESLECPTILLNGFGAHQIEGIGDKHIPWIHDARNTDMVVDIHDQQCMNLLRLFNEDKGKFYLVNQKFNKDFVDSLELLGISSIANLLAAIKVSKYFEYDENDVVFTVLTDSADLYRSRIVEQREMQGDYTEQEADVHYRRDFLDVKTDYMKELNYYDRKSIHNFKYFTWIEQQGKTIEELNELWKPEFWDETFSQVSEWDEYIEEFNRRTGLLEKL